MGNAPARPALRYFGGKWKIARWIVSHFPGHTCYVEPFGGAASVLLHKIPSFIEVYNDLNGGVVNFFRVLRERPAELLAAIDLTPYSRAEFLQAQEPCDDPVERARRFYVWAWQGRGRAGVREPGGWRFMKRATRSQTPVDDWNNHRHLWGVVRRLKEVQIEQDDALSVVQRYDAPQTLFYLDPPYLQDTRSGRWGNGAYAFEYERIDHCRLAEALRDIEGMAIVSGYPSDLYDDLYAGWGRVTRLAPKSGGRKGGMTAVECLWLSPNAMRGREAQLGLMLEEGEGV
jgi:DNA adenine methylase